MDDNEAFWDWWSETSEKWGDGFSRLIHKELRHRKTYPLLAKRSEATKGRNPLFPSEHDPEAFC
jgi:hypothetical protein